MVLTFPVRISVTPAAGQGAPNIQTSIFEIVDTRVEAEDIPDVYPEVGTDRTLSRRDGGGGLTVEADGGGATRGRAGRPFLEPLHKGR